MSTESEIKAALNLADHRENDAIRYNLGAEVIPYIWRGENIDTGALRILATEVRRLRVESTDWQARALRAEALLEVADKILDDIDTAGDALKPEMTPYFRVVSRKCQEGQKERRQALSERGGV